MTYGRQPHPHPPQPYQQPSRGPQYHPPRQPPPGMPGHRPPPACVIDVGRDATVKAVIGGAVAGAVGLMAVVSALTDAVTGGAAEQITVAVIGVVFLGIGGLPLIMWQKVARPRKLIFEAQGVRWDDPRGRPWAVEWRELAGVAISRTKQRRVQPADYVWRKVMVRLDLFPADPGFRLRHPQMEHLWEFHRVKNGYRLPLGSSPKYIPVIEDAMRQHRPGVYQGVRDEGFVVGLV